MRNILILFFVISILLFTNCKKDNKGFDTDTYIDILFEDQLGNDLLNPATPNYYPEKDIRVFSLHNGNKAEIYHGNLDHPRDINIYENKDLEAFVLKLYPEINIDTMLLQLNENTVDTVNYSIERTDFGVYLRKFWYNGVLKWEDYNIPKLITIIK